MIKRSGYADLPLHRGTVPKWLADRMMKLGTEIVEALIINYGKKEVLVRLSDPLWFQSLGCVLGMDWHSSGITTSVMYALKRGLNRRAKELGIVVCGGRGKYSRKTPEELMYAGTFNIKYEKEFHNKLFKDNEIAFVYVYLGEIDIDDITVQEEELECVEWFDLEETYNECLAHNQKFCVPVKGLETARQYLDSMNK